MTYVNVPVETWTEVEAQHRAFQSVHELEFWKTKAETLRRELENVFDHAKATGHVELWRNGVKLDLYTAKVTSAE
jgi:hypothetical protein